MALVLFPASFGAGVEIQGRGLWGGNTATAVFESSNEILGVPRVGGAAVCRAIMDLSPNLNS